MFHSSHRCALTRRIVFSESPVERGRSAPSNNTLPSPIMRMFLAGFISATPSPQLALRIKLSRHLSESLILVSRRISVVSDGSKIASSISHQLRSGSFFETRFSKIMRSPAPTFNAAAIRSESLPVSGIEFTLTADANPATIADIAETTIFLFITYDSIFLSIFCHVLTIHMIISMAH